jgi:hypothetical protein
MITLQGVVPGLGPAPEGIAIFLQGAAFDAGAGHVVLGNGEALVFLDAAL